MQQSKFQIIVGADQYADGRAARVWQMYIGGTSTRTQKYKKFLVDILRRHDCKSVFDVACGTGYLSLNIICHKKIC